jgi:hypothetical protein
MKETFAMFNADGQSIVFGFQPTIWMIHATNWTTAEPEELGSNDLLKHPAQPFGLNGLALTPDGPYLIASLMDRLDAGDGRLVRLDLKTTLDVHDVFVCFGLGGSNHWIGRIRWYIVHSNE